MVSDALRLAREGNESPETASSLSAMLFKSLPRQEDIDRIYRAVPEHHAMPYETMTMPYASLERNEVPDRFDRATPNSSAHPVLIARHMLFLASLLQHLHPDVHDGIKDLSEPPQDMSRKLADLAITHVTSKDEHLGSIEGLTCIVMESVYHANAGNIRRSWITVRRAIAVAQLMGLSKQSTHASTEVLERNVPHEPKILWSRIVFLDRFLCLLLGLPQACSSSRTSFEGLQNAKLPLHDLERVHCMVASGILDRRDVRSHDDNASLTATLDAELQLAAHKVPSRWWALPGLASGGKANVHHTGRLFAQVLHYNLLNQLHLPYMLHSTTSERSRDYALVTCVSASREILSRFLVLRSLNGTMPSCRIVDFIALMAATTLLLAHLDNQHRANKNLLAHQYHSDRAMVEQVQEAYYQAGSGLHSEPVSRESAELLGKLLAVDIDTFGQAAGRITIYRADTFRNTQATEGIVRIDVPYFGVIQIARQQKAHLTAPTEQYGCSPLTTRSDDLSLPNEEPARQHMSPVAPAGAFTDSRPELRPYNDIDNSFPTYGLLQHLDEAPLAPPDFDPAAPTFSGFPGLTAGTGDWAFQGVDMAYFDNLMMYQGVTGMQ